ncbi:MAG: hypothetical protein SH847_04750 [Roseiflexaceae bacterium]|nr:hypothetical protein [Roseiflexaceae bacterium]
MSDDNVRQELLQRIRSRRASIDAFVRQLEPRGARLNNVSIVCSSLATVLTAGPALGGEQFSGGVKNLLQLGSDSVVWQVLCFAAMLLSIVATVATNMQKSSDATDRLAKAHACNAQLDGLETAIALGQIQIGEAVKLYQQYIAAIPFIRDQPVT